MPGNNGTVRKLMSGRARLPGGEPRKASQRNKPNVSSSGAAKIPPTWQPGARVHWKDRVGTFRRDLGDGEHAEIVIEQRVYRVRIGELGDPQLMSGAVIRRTRPT